LPRFSGGAAGGGEVGAARGRAGQWQCRWKAAGSRQETGDRRQAGGGRQSVAFDTGPYKAFKGGEAGTRLHSLATCLSTCVYPGERGARGRVLHALSPGAAYASCPPPVAAGRGRADGTRHRRRQKCFSSRLVGLSAIVLYPTYVGGHIAAERVKPWAAQAQTWTRTQTCSWPLPLPPWHEPCWSWSTAMVPARHPSQHPDPLCSPPTRQLANSHPEPRVTCNEGHPVAVCRLPFAVLGSQVLGR
jgi:hypothetical protein